MKRIISFILVIVMLCSCAVVSTSALTGDKKFSKNTYEILSEYDDTSVLSVSIEVDTEIKFMESWEFYWRNEIDASRFEDDRNYALDAAEKYGQYMIETEKQKVVVMNGFYFNEFKPIQESYASFNGQVGIIGAFLPVSEIKRLESFDKVLGVSINTGGVDTLFHGKPEEFATEIYNEEYLINTTEELVDVEYYGLDGMYALFRGGQIVSDEKSEIIIEDFLIIGSLYTHSEDNPTGLFAITESGVVRTVEELYDMNVLHMDRLAMRLPYVYLIGDADYDLSITIMDATAIQRVLAGIDEYKDVVCVSRPEDKDRDGNVTIMDATAVQREIAGLVS